MNARRILIARYSAVIFAAILAAFSTNVYATDHNHICAESTDKNHVDADQVGVETHGRDATIVITHKRGIGGAQVTFDSKWSGHLRINFHNFGNLENFVITNGDKCISGSSRPAAQYMGTWKNNHCDCPGARQSTTILKTRVVGTDIQMEIPRQLMPSKRARVLQLAWIDAYR